VRARAVCVRVCVFACVLCVFGCENVFLTCITIVGRYGPKATKRPLCRGLDRPGRHSEKSVQKAVDLKEPAENDLSADF
jgi:hypothetical protein